MRLLLYQNVKTLKLKFVKIKIGKYRRQFSSNIFLKQLKYYIKIPMHSSKYQLNENNSTKNKSKCLYIIEYSKIKRFSSEHKKCKN